MSEEEPIIRQILEDSENATDTYPIVVSDVYLLFIGIAWIVVCFAIFIFGKKCIERRIKNNDDERIPYQH